MNGLLTAGFACVCLSIFGLSVPAQAGWLINETRRHVSAHGRMECLECHGDVAQAAQHPNADRVDRGPAEPFAPERCTGCHGSVADDLQKGLHGGRPADAATDYDRCVACHNPHEQLKAADADRFDPARPPQAQCGNCHASRSRLPQPSRDDDTCLTCHSRYDIKTSAGVRAARTLCLACHGREDDSLRVGAVGRVPVVDLGPDGLKPHQDVACLTCHPGSAQYGHARQAAGDCRQCHVRHPEAVTHDAHLSVSCEACHLSDVLPTRDARTGEIRWVRQSGHPSRVHVMAPRDGDAACRRCHRSPNALGAAAMVLPPKSVLCMPCHAATFSVGDVTTLLALLVFGCGLAGSLSYWFSGRRAAGEGPTPGRKQPPPLVRAAAVARALFYDGLLQRAFFRQSPGRWLVHALIVWPFFLRFLWGILAWAGSRWAPGSTWPWLLLDRNGWANGLFFDLTGLVVIAAVAVAILHGRSQGAAARLPGMPQHDWVSSGLLGAVVLVGFLLEGIRIAMTGYPPGSGFAFVGDAISRFFYRSSGLEDIYGVVWYTHAVLTGFFVAWLPFSRMFHIVLAPVLLAVNAAGGHRTPAR
jgi:hypothetical protein